jgi:hypothetical protein
MRTHSSLSQDSAQRSSDCEERSPSPPKTWFTIYVIIMGILIIGVAAFVGRSTRQRGMSTTAVEVVTAAILTICAGYFADPILRLFRSKTDWWRRS